jgi:hypothetical protein
MNLIVHDRDTGEVLPPIGFSVERTANDTTAILKTSINCGYNVKLLKVWFRFAFMNEMNESADLWAPVKVPIGDRFIEMSPRIPEAYPECMYLVSS